MVYHTQKRKFVWSKAAEKLNQWTCNYYICLTRASMIEDLKIIKAQLENEQLVNNQVSKNNKKNVSVSKQNNVKQKNKTKSILNSEAG